MLDNLPPHPEPSLDTGVAVSAVRAAEVAGPLAAETESLRRLHPEAMRAVLDAGFARHFVPVELGGRAGNFEELTRAVVTLGESCTATAWCASLAANLARMAAYLPAQGRKDVWDEGPDTLVVGSLSPFGTAQRAPGGYRLTGRWPYISGVDFADWALLCGTLTGDGAPVPLVFAVPRAEFEVIESWDSVGMSGTGSNTVAVDRLLVPAERTFLRADLLSGRPADSEAPCHTVPLEAANGLSFAAPLLGAARGTQRAWTEHVATKTAALAGRTGAPGPSRASYADTLARSVAEIDSAQLLLERCAAVADRGAAVTRLERTRNLRDCAYAVELLVSAVDRFFRTAGTSGQLTDRPIQRFWRDVNSGSTHIALQFEAAAGAYAEQRL
ncbi:acyl-CoA dehydrogenase family protein [Streptomyces sp. NPDC057680]|uniref:acyl-CoA dehydrogenase family protein n=1 Tax=Streptomyces sp. NPDC057680 TaxID=3346208 RepID=UPI0036BE01BB